MKLITFIEKPKVGYPVSIGVVLAAIVFIVSGFFGIGCIVGGLGVGLMTRVAQPNGQYPTRQDRPDKMKQLFLKYAKWCYGIAITLWIAAVVLFFHGGHDDCGEWMGIGGIALGLLVADATGKLVPLRKHKD